MRAAIIEPFEAGHRAVYVRWIATALLGAGIDVTVAGSRGLTEHAELSPLRESSSGEAHRLVSCVVDPPPLTINGLGKVGLGRSELRMRNWMSRAYACAQAHAAHDVVIVPYLDYCFHAIATLGSPFGAVPWCGITMNTNFAAEGREELRQTMRHYLLRRILTQSAVRAVFTIDPRYSPGSVGGDAGYDRKLRYLADPAEMPALPSSVSARASLGISPEHKVLLLFGSIDPRKGLREAIAGMRSTSKPGEWRLIIAGKQTRDAVRLLDDLCNDDPELRESLSIVDGLIPAARIPLLFASCDAVWVGYPGHRAMSGVLVQGALAGKPVIAEAGSLIGQLVAAAGIGIVCDLSSPIAIASALEAVVCREFAEAARTRGPAYFSEHTPRAFGERILEVVRRGGERAAA